MTRTLSGAVGTSAVIGAAERTKRASLLQSLGRFEQASFRRAALEAVIAAQAGLIVLNEDFTIAHRVEIISLAARYQLPTVYPFRFFAELGGLLSYGVDLIDNFRPTAIYADRVIKGEKTADLPVQAPSKFQLVINLKTAKALGLTISRDFLLVADEVIE
jgi:putative ABC transport system substrate-binding protein